jgi:hypothetical protein
MSDLVDTPTNQYADPTPLAEPQKNSKLMRVAAIARELRELFPGQETVQLYVHGDYATLTFHSVATYEAGTELMRSLEIQTRRKQIVQSGTPFCNLEAEVDGLTVSAYCHTMPPTCRLEKVVERIPKSQTVETGEYIEVERVRVVCGNGDKEGA